MKLKDTVKKMTTALLVLILFFNLITLALSLSGLRDPLRWLPLALLAVDSGSMEPVFSPGDALLVAETPYDGLEIGDIITFRRGAELISHEIVGKTSNRYLTRGRANNYYDEPVGPEEYCAKVISILPKAGWILAFLSRPSNLLLISILMAALLYGRPLLGFLYERLSGKSAKSADARSSVRRTGIGRIVALFAGISCVMAAPCVTAAKYTAKLNAYESLLASSIHFSSNYLTREGGEYHIRGWDGEAYQINLRVNNYDNDLLWNMDGQDLLYGLCVIPVESDGGGVYALYGADRDYTVNISPLDANPVEGAPYSWPAGWPGENRYGPYRMLGDSSAKQTQNFMVSVAASGLEAGEKVKFRIAAATSEQDQFFIELLGVFTLEVRSSESFLGPAVITQSPGSALVTFYISTNLITDGDAVKDVCFTWNTEKLYINEAEPLVAEIIENQPECYDREAGTLIVPMQAYSSATLQFFKYEPEETVSEEPPADIRAEVLS